MIKSKVPLRISFAGGGTDVSPYCDLYGGNVFNATINRYAYCTIEDYDAFLCRFESLDQDKTESYFSSTKCKINEYQGDLKLHFAVYKHFYDLLPNKDLKITTLCEAPVGSGLGTSSALVVALIKAFDELLNLSLDEYEIAKLAYHLEREVCRFAGGKQDQFAASFGGFNFMEFNKDSDLVIPLRLKKWIISELEQSLILFYTGTSRDSANIIQKQSKSIMDNEYGKVEATHEIKKQARILKESLLKGDFYSFNESLNLAWENKKKMCDGISNSKLDEIYSKALECGALSGKISGAGGGGFMFFFVPLNYRNKVIKLLNRYSEIIESVTFVEHGAVSWKL